MLLTKYIKSIKYLKELKQKDGRYTYIHVYILYYICVYV